MEVHHYIFLLLTGLLAAFLCWYFWKRYNLHKALHNVYYLMGFAVLLVSGLLLLILGLGILASPWVLTVATLIPLGISIGLVEEYFPKWKKIYKWFAVVGFLAIAIGGIGEIELLRKISVPVFHGVAGLIILLVPFLAKKTPQGFFWVGIGGLLIGIGGILLAFTKPGNSLGFIDIDFVMLVLTPVLFLMTGAFALGFAKKG
jgi:hypothetical protein